MHELSGKELLALKELSSGLQYKEIAAKLGVSVNTIKKHLKNIYRKKDLKNRKHAARYYRNLVSANAPENSGTNGETSS